jgi:hypothetical protein
MVSLLLIAKIARIPGNYGEIIFHVPSSEKMDDECGQDWQCKKYRKSDSGSISWCKIRDYFIVSFAVKCLILKENRLFILKNGIRPHGEKLTL